MEGGVSLRSPAAASYHRRNTTSTFINSKIAEPICQRKLSTTSPASFKSILLSVDGSENSLRAARVGIDLAKREGASLFVLHFIQAPTYTEIASLGMISSPCTVYFIDIAKQY